MRTDLVLSLEDRNQVFAQEITRYVGRLLSDESGFWRTGIRELFEPGEPCPSCEGSGFEGEIDRFSPKNQICRHCVEGRVAQEPNLLGSLLKERAEQLRRSNSGDVISCCAAMVVSIVADSVDWQELAEKYT